MKVVCVYCATEGKPALMGEKAPLDDPRQTHGVCAEHLRRLARPVEDSAERTISGWPRAGVP